MSRILKVKVEEIRPGGIVVHILFDGRKGFVRWRELSWDRRIGFQPQYPQKGNLIEVVKVDEPIQGYYVPLSVRRITDPWLKLGESYKPGMTVKGEVVNVRKVGVFVQLEPGIDALLSMSDIPMLPNEVIETVLRIGDKVEAVITLIDIGRQQISISITQWLIELSKMTIAQRKERLLDHFKYSLLLNISSEPQLEITSSTNLTPSIKTFQYLPLRELKSVLVVDDEITSLNKICTLLERKFDVSTTGVRCGDEVMEWLELGSVFELAIIDIHLDIETGLFVAQRLLAKCPKMEIIFISSVSVSIQEIPEIQGRTFLFSSKDPEELEGVIEKITQGSVEVVKSQPKTISYDQSLFAKQLGINKNFGEPIGDLIAKMVSTIRKETNSAYALLIEVEPRAQTAWIVSIDPPMTRDLRSRSEDGLYYSPVRDVAENEQEYYYVQEDEEERMRELQNFLPQLEFRTCLGIPLRTSTTVTRHALFLLDKNLRHFLPRQVDEIRFSAQSIQWVLERNHMLTYMRKYEQRYTLGFLLSSLVHELSNKLDGLSGYSRSLDTVLNELVESDTQANLAQKVETALVMSRNILDIKDEIAKLLNSYSRTASDSLDSVDIPELLQKTKKQFSTYAREQEVTLEIECSERLPMAKSIQAHLEQIITNIVVNAIQQISRQRNGLMQSITYATKQQMLLRKGIILIRANFLKSNAPYPLQISIIDSGPGIHYVHREEIFQMGVSMRQEGHGLGLFISRSLMENMGGRLRLADSTMFIGSVFAIDLPIAQTAGGINK